MRAFNSAQQTKIAAAIASLFMTQLAYSDDLPLVQYPAGSAHKMPIPNVILSVDDSGSMSSGGRMTTLKQSLRDVLVNTSKYDNQIRIAWQSLHACNNIPSSQTNCGGKNAMATFADTHKSNFAAWVETLSPLDNTPSHTMMWNAGEYLKTTGDNSPWNAKPGTSDSSPITCRRAYHVFMTDGGWNAYLPTNGNYRAGNYYSSFDFWTKMRLDNSDNIRNADNTKKTLPGPDSKTYDPASPQSVVYKDEWGGGKITSSKIDYARPTLADMAFHYWATDLQPTIDNKIPFEPKRTDDEIFTDGTKSVTLEPYWNPRNDPAKWQHMVNYTIGFGTGAANWTNFGTNPIFSGGMYGSGFTDIVLGNKAWANPISGNENSRPEELWHMAINSRGKFYPVEKSEDLAKAFDEIFSSIVADNSSPLTSFTSASGSISRSETEVYQTAYVAAEDKNSNNNRWYGFVASEKIRILIDPLDPNKRDFKLEPNPDWGTNPAKVAPNNHMTTADKLDARDHSTRVVITYNDASDEGIAFSWGATTPLSSEQQRLLNNGTIAAAAGDGLGKDRLNFLRGDRTKEEKNGGKFRNRKTIQGDIVNSAVWYAGPPASNYSFDGYSSFSRTNKVRKPMLYVGGNDGMLHGFSAKDGEEYIAYVPQGVYKNLSKISEPGYSHLYYVDGSPFTGDLNLGSNASPDWRTYLVGTLAAGGKGYFVLDVSKPGTTDDSVATNFSQTNAKSLVVMDTTDGADDDIGHIFGTPVVDESNPQRNLQIARTNNGRWALITGNGYNSKNQRPVLLIQYLDGDKSLVKLSGVPVTDPAHEEAIKNGLSTPQFLDVNADGSPDFVYAGDLRGNMWKFDISGNSSSLWNVAFGGKPLFSAAAPSRQPITTQPLLRPNRSIGGLMVAFGTGRNITEGDRSDTSLQSVYAVLDNTRYELSKAADSKGKVIVKSSDPTPTPITGGRNALMEQKQSAKISDSDANRDFWTLTESEIGKTVATKDTPYAYDCTGKKGCTVIQGWYFDFPVDGERVVSSMDFFDGGNILEIMSEVPASGGVTTSAEERCDPSPKAAAPYRTLIHIEKGSRPQTPLMDVNKDGYYTAAGDKFASRMTAASKELRFSTKDLQIRKGSDGITDKLSKVPNIMMRPGWRQLK